MSVQHDYQTDIMIFVVILYAGDDFHMCSHTTSLNFNNNQCLSDRHWNQSGLVSDLRTQGGRIDPLGAFDVQQRCPQPTPYWALSEIVSIGKREGDLLPADRKSLRGFAITDYEISRGLR